MSKPLSKEQMEYLYRFMHNKGVMYDDVKLELVDHFATHIEEEGAVDSMEDFKGRVKVIYDTFNDREFRTLIKEKQKGLHQKYRRMAWQFTRSFFTWPKIGLSLLLTTVVFMLLQHWVEMVPFFHYVAGGAFVLCVISVVMVYRHGILWRKKFLFIQSARLLFLSAMGAIYALFMAIPRFIEEYGYAENTWVLLGLSVYLVFFFFFYYAHLIFVQQVALKDLAQIRLQFE
jgi:hypothetical protein